MFSGIFTRKVVCEVSSVVQVLHWLVTDREALRMFNFQSKSVATSDQIAKRYFAAYEVTKKALTPAGASPSELNLGAIILAGGTAGVAMWSLAIPPDVGFSGIVAWFTYRLINWKRNTGAQIKVAIGANRNILRSAGLCTQDDCTGWCPCALEGIRPRNGTGTCLLKSEMCVITHLFSFCDNQAFPANAATFVSSF